MNLNYQMVLILFQKFKIIVNSTLKSTKHETIHIYINRVNNRLVFKIKDGYKLELQTHDTMKIYCSIKN